MEYLLFLLILDTIMEDRYLTVSRLSTAKLVEKKSVFYAFAIPVFSEEEIEQMLREYRKKYYDARHVCYAYSLRADKSLFRFSDNGEPSGTAGRPIMNVIQAGNLTNILIIIVRYFGGIKLGTSGLISAYKEASELVVSNAEIIERTEDISFQFSFDYGQMNMVMSAVKSLRLVVEDSQFSMQCFIKVRGPKSIVSLLKEKLENKVCLIKKKDNP